MTSYDDQDETAYGSELSRTMDAALAHLPSRNEMLVTVAVERGTRTRRRRRLAAWGAACSAVTALTTAALLFALPGRGDDLTTIALPDFSAVGASAPAGQEPVTGAATAALLAELLPRRPGVTDVEALDSDPAYGSVQTYGRLTLEDGGTVAVWLQGGFALPQEAEPTAAPTGEVRDSKRPGPKGEGSKGEGGTPAADRTHTPGQPELKKHYSCPREQEAKRCLLTKLGDGSVLLAHEDRTNSTIARTADLLRPDGTRIVVTATGTGLTDAQVRAVAASARWQQWVDPATNDAAVTANSPKKAGS